MHPARKALYVSSYLLQTTFNILIVYPLIIIFGIVFLIVTLPYTLFYHSAHCKMHENYHAVVEIYLNYFEHLHPNLMAYVAACHSALAQVPHEPPGVRDWPHQSEHTSWCIPCVVSVEETTWSFSNAAGLFAKLEASGWQRRLLWTFLRDQVEQTGWTTAEQREAFGHVMGVMNSHYLFNSTRRWFKRATNGADAEKERAAEERLAGLGLPIVHVRSDSLDWLLQPGVLLIPNDETRAMMQTLAKYGPIWGKIPQEQDAEKGPLDGRWQIIDARNVYPWTDK